MLLVTLSSKKPFETIASIASRWWCTYRCDGSASPGPGSLIPLGDSLLTFLSDGKTDSLALGEGDVRLVGLADHKHVAQTGGHGVVRGILDVNDLKGSRVLLPVGDGAYTSQVTASSNHAQVTAVEFDVVGYLAGGDVDLDGVVDLDKRVWVADGASVVGAEVRYSLGSSPDLANLAQFELGFFAADSVDNESSLDIVDKTEVLSSLVDGDYIHESSRVGDVSAHLAVDLDKTLHHDLLGLHVGQSVLETVAQEDDEGQTFSQLVRSSGCTGSKVSIELPKHPMLGSI